VLQLYVFISVGEEVYATVSQFWSEQQLFFEVIAPDEVAYVYKIQPARDFGVPLVSCFDFLLP